MLTNRCKTLLFATNFNGEKNQIGTTDLPYAPTTQNMSLNAAGPFYHSINESSVSSHYSTYKLFKNLYLCCFSNEVDPTPNVTGYGLPIYGASYLQSIHSNSYNKTEEKVSYQNPVILHVTTTFKNVRSIEPSITIYGIGLCASTCYYGTASSNSILLGLENFDTPIVVNSGDTITFTVIIK